MRFCIVQHTANDTGNPLRSNSLGSRFPTTSAYCLPLAELGDELAALHLLRSSRLNCPIATYTGRRNPEVSRVGWSDDTVWLNAGMTNAREGHRATKPGTIGFKGVAEQVWNFHIGGYQVCHKWLKDRKGSTLSDEDAVHYQKIVVALNETIRIMAEIDEVIGAHGGWPGAFHTASGSAERRPALLRVAESSPPYGAGKGGRSATSERRRDRRPLFRHEQRTGDPLPIPAAARTQRSSDPRHVVVPELFLITLDKPGGVPYRCSGTTPEQRRQQWLTPSILRA